MPAVLVDQAVHDVRVADGAPQRNAVPRQHAHGVFQMVTDLGDRFRLEHRAQVVERLPVTGLVGRERRPDRRVRSGGEGDADDGGALRIVDRALQGDRHLLLLEQLGSQRLPLRRRGGDAVVVIGVVDGRHATRARRVGRAGAEQPFLEQAELQPVEDGDGGVDVGVEPRKAVQIEFHRYVDVDGRQALGQQRLLPVLLDPFALLALQAADAGYQRFDRAEPRQQFLRGLVADAGHAGDVVDRIAHQRQHVDHLSDLGYAPALAHFGRPVDRRRAARRAAQPVQRGAVGDQLRQILVRRHQHRAEAGRLGPRGDGADHVVGLRADPGDLRDAQRRGDGAHVVERLKHLFRRLFPLRLVLAVLVVAAVAAGAVKHHRHVRGPLLLHDLDQRVGVAERGRGVDAAGGEARVGQKDEVRLIDDRHAVDQEQPPLRIPDWLIPARLFPGCRAAGGQGAAHAVRSLPRRAPSQLYRSAPSPRCRTC